MSAKAKSFVPHQPTAGPAAQHMAVQEMSPEQLQVNTKLMSSPLPQDMMCFDSARSNSYKSSAQSSSAASMFSPNSNKSHF